MANDSDQEFSAELSALSGFADRASSNQVGSFEVLLRRKWLILCTALLGASVFGAYAYLATPEYSAEALVVTNQPEFGQEVFPSAAARESQAAQLMSEIDLIKSPAFISRISDRFDLVDDPEFKGLSVWSLTTVDSRPDGAAPSPSFFLSPRQNAEVLLQRSVAWARALIFPNAPAMGDSLVEAPRRSDIQTARTIRAISRHLSISNDGHSVTIQIRFSSSDPVKAAKLANAFADDYAHDKLDIKKQQSATINTWLDSRIGELGRRVVAADRAVQVERQRLHVSEAGSAGPLFDQTLIQWNTQLVTAQTRRLEAEARLATAKKMLAEADQARSTVDVLNSPLIQHLREQKSLLTALYANLVSRSGANYPPAMALKRQIDDLSRSLETETQKIVDALRNEVGTARAAENVVTQALTDANRRADDAQLELTTIRELEQRAASERTLYDQFLRKFNETLGYNYLPQSDVRTISSAFPPDHPSYPQPMLFIPAGLLLGVFCGILKALHSAGSERTFRDTRSVELATELPAFGLIPIRRKRRIRSTSALAAETYYEQSIARVGTILNHLGRPGNPPKIVAVTSALPQDGKSTFCVAVARSAAEAGKRVLVIELDRHRPTLAKLFRNNNRNGGLTDLIAGTKTLSEVVQRDQLSNVDFVPLVNRSQDKQQLVSLNRLHSLFSHVRDAYDLVLVDTAPILANADIAAVASVLDTCVFVVRWGETPRDAVTAALRQLRLLNIPAPGIVLTCVNPAEANSNAEGRYYGQIVRYHASRGPA